MIGQRKSSYLKTCRTRVKSAQNYRQQEGLDKLWDDLKDLYRGKHFPSGLNDEDRIAVNLAFSTINIIGPSVSVNHPKITVNANKPEDEDRAVIVESVINYWWRTKDIRPEFALAVQDFLIFGFGWIKTGYRFVEQEKQRDADAIAADVSTGNDQADAYAQDNPDLAGSLPTPDEVAASVPDTEMEVVDDTVFVDRVSPHDVFVDPMATKLDNAAWIAQRIVKPLDEVRKNPRYKRSVRTRVDADAVTAEKFWQSEDVRSKERNNDAKQCIVWEYYDLKNGQMCVFTEGGEDFLVDPVEQPYTFGHPFTMLRNYEVPDQFYPMGELEAIEGLQQELNKTRSQVMNDRKRYRRKYLYDPKAFSPTAVGMLESSKDGAYVPVNEGVALNESVIPLPLTPLDPNIYQQSQEIAADINTVSGVNEYQRGGGEQAIRRTATEASMIQDSANSRAQYKLGRIEDFITMIAKRLVALAQQYMTQDQVVRIVGADQGPPLWVHVEPHMIEGEFDFDVEAGSTKPVNESQRRDQAMQLFQLVGPMVGTGMINEPAVLKYVFQYGFGIKNPSKFLGPAALKPPGSNLGDPNMAPPPGGQPAATGQGEPMPAPPTPPGSPAGPSQPPSPDGPMGGPAAAQLRGQVGLQLPNQ